MKKHNNPNDISPAEKNTNVPEQLASINSKKPIF